LASWAKVLFASQIMVVNPSELWGSGHEEELAAAILRIFSGWIPIQTFWARQPGTTKRWCRAVRHINELGGGTQIMSAFLLFTLGMDWNLSWNKGSLIFHNLVKGWGGRRAWE
jgi:hypothetical protein